MTTLRFPVAALFICLLVCSGCKEQSTAVQLVSANASFTLDGGGFNNQVVSINSGGNPRAAVGSYVASQSQTACSVGNGGGARLLSVSFGKAQPDTFYWGARTLPTKSGSVDIAIDGKQYISIAGIMIVTEYGAVGGTIRGTFSGTLIEFIPEPPLPLEPNEVQIKNGVFSVVRLEDQP